MKSFQILIVAIFIGCALFAVLVFSGAVKIGKQDSAPGSLGTVTIWGTVGGDVMNNVIEEFNNNQNNLFTINYSQKSADTFNDELLEALASGKGPDLFLLPDYLGYKYTNKIYTIPYTSYPLASFKNTFVGAGEVFMNSKGILALPLTVDPMVMYYNRTILDSNNIIYPPAYWDDFASLVSTITKKDDSKQIVKSAVALGQFSNITNAKDILATLFMQTGNTIVSERSNFYRGTLSEYAEGAPSTVLGSVLAFYTSFSDPLSQTYSWNRSLPPSKDYFSSEHLAFYFGFSSELQSLVNKNPNQNFQIAAMPQIKNSNSKVTSSHVTGVAISSSSKNLSTAITAATTLATGDFAQKFALASNIPPARRDLLVAKPTDAYTPLFYASALYAKSWLDPDREGTNLIFKNMIEGVLSNSLSPENAISDADGKLNLLLLK